MSHTLAIVTGSSRGLGRALLQRLVAPGNCLLGIARREADLGARAAQAGASLEQWPLDLADAPAVAQRLRAWLAAQDGNRFDRAILVNNAAFLSTPGPLDRSAIAELTTAARVGLEAPLLLTAAFIDGTRTWPGRRQVLNISSGLGRRAMAGSAAYCAVKAGMDHFSRAVALEQAGEANGCRIESVAPGIIDTDMQQQLRGADAARFPEQATFAGFHAQGQLDTPDGAAAKLMRRLERADFGAEPVTDVRGG
ncbi:MAG: SDR family NAD(P)-dependent oxidoreductase [Aquabacterium sp.]